MNEFCVEIMLLLYIETQLFFGGSCTYQAYGAAAPISSMGRLFSLLKNQASLRDDHSRCVAKKLLLPPILILGISQNIPWNSRVWQNVDPIYRVGWGAVCQRPEIFFVTSSENSSETL